MNKTEKKQAAESLRRTILPLMGKMGRYDLPLEREQAQSDLLHVADTLMVQLGLGMTFWPLLMEWEQNNYRPTLRSDIDPRYGVLADLYDFFQAYRGMNVVAYRG
jgi:hypothetical protein